MVFRSSLIIRTTPHQLDFAMAKERKAAGTRRKVVKVEKQTTKTQTTEAEKAMKAQKKDTKTDEEVDARPMLNEAWVKSRIKESNSVWPFEFVVD